MQERFEGKAKIMIRFGIEMPLRRGAVPRNDSFLYIVVVPKVFPITLLAVRLLPHHWLEGG